MERYGDSDVRDETLRPGPKDFERALDRNEANDALRQNRAATPSEQPYSYAAPSPAPLRADERADEPRSFAPGPQAPPTTTATTYGATATPPRTATPPTTTTTQRRVGYAEEPPGPFSFAAGFLGWAVAAFFTLLFVTMILAILGSAAYNDATITNDGVIISRAAMDNLAWPGIVGGLIAVLAGYVLGGYNAARIDRDHGVGQGLAVVGWTIALGVVGAVIAAAAADFFNVGDFLAPYVIDWTALTTQAAIGLVLTLLVMLGGAILGGLAGERWMRRDVSYEARARSRAYRTRPRV